ncbi:hypothetical protein Hanom_Chr05g00406871 [Helianthus anomalus]
MYASATDVTVRVDNGRMSVERVQRPCQQLLPTEVPGSIWHWFQKPVRPPPVV